MVEQMLADGIAADVIVRAVASAELALQRRLLHEANRGVRLPTNWQPSGACTSFAFEAGIDQQSNRVEARVQELLDGRNRQGATKLDWEARPGATGSFAVERNAHPLAINRPAPIPLPDLHRRSGRRPFRHGFASRVASIRDNHQPDLKTGKHRMVATLPRGLTLNEANVTRSNGIYASLDALRGPTPADDPHAEVSC